MKWREIGVSACIYDTRTYTQGSELNAKAVLLMNLHHNINQSRPQHTYTIDSYWNVRSMILCPAFEKKVLLHLI